jgi:hypothetical protein
MATVEGTIYLCPRSCSQLVDSTPTSERDSVTITAPEDGVEYGTAIIVLKPYAVTNLTPYSAGTIKLRTITGPTCGDILSWQRTDRGIVTVTYAAPDDCNWEYSELGPRKPPNLTIGAGWPLWSWLLEPEQAVVQPANDDTKADAYTLLGDSNTTNLTVLSMVPGTYVAAYEYHLNLAGNRIGTLILSEWGTPNVTGGYITNIGGVNDLDLTVTVFGESVNAKASDHRSWSVDDWVVLVQNCCQDNNGNLPNCSPYVGGAPAEFQEFGPDNILTNPDNDYITLPVGYSLYEPVSEAIHRYSSTEWAASLDLSVHRGEVTAVDTGNDTCTVAFENDFGTIADIPVKYIAQGESSYTGGAGSIGVGANVLVLNKSGTSTPVAGDLIVFSVCDRYVLYFYNEDYYDVGDGYSKYCFFWDKGTDNYLQGVTYNNGDPVLDADWPVLESDISDWILANFQESQYPEYFFEVVNQQGTHHLNESTDSVTNYCIPDLDNRCTEDEYITNNIGTVFVDQFFTPHINYFVGEDEYDPYDVFPFDMTGYRNDTEVSAEVAARIVVVEGEFYKSSFIPEYRYDRYVNDIYAEVSDATDPTKTYREYDGPYQTELNPTAPHGHDQTHDWKFRAVIKQRHGDDYRTAWTHIQLNRTGTSDGIGEIKGAGAGNQTAELDIDITGTMSLTIPGLGIEESFDYLWSQTNCTWDDSDKENPTGGSYGYTTGGIGTGMRNGKWTDEEVAITYLAIFKHTETVYGTYTNTNDTPENFDVNTNNLDIYAWQADGSEYVGEEVEVYDRFFVADNRSSNLEAAIKKMVLTYQQPVSFATTNAGGIVEYDYLVDSDPVQGIPGNHYACGIHLPDNLPHWDFTVSQSVWEKSWIWGARIYVPECLLVKI